MKSEDQVAEPAEIPPAATTSKALLLVALAAIVGILLSIIVGGTLYHFQSQKSLTAELATTKASLKEKTQLLAGMQQQIDGLSRQMRALRDFSVAKAESVAEETATKAKTETSPAVPIHNEEKVPTAIKKTGAAKTAETARVTELAKAGPVNQDCQLAGKTPQEQSSTLQRCLEEIDKGKNRRR